LSNIPYGRWVMADQPHTLSLGTGIEALRSSGFLFALNEHVLHGAGFEARLDGDELVLAGWGNTPLQWTAPPEAVDTAWRQYRQTLITATSKNRPGYWDGHSPGFGGRVAGGPA